MTKLKSTCCVLLESFKPTPTCTLFNEEEFNLIYIIGLNITIMQMFRFSVKDLFCLAISNLFYRKLFKIPITRSTLLAQNALPGPTGGAYSAPLDPLARL